jgi:hypothetical protein
MRIVLPIEGEAMISLGAKSVRHPDWMLPALDYGNVRDVSHLGKHRDGLPIQGDSEVKMMDLREVHMPTAKKQVLEMVKKLPEKATWDDIMYEIYVRKKIEAGINAAEEGRVVPHEAVKKRFLKKYPASM